MKNCAKCGHAIEKMYSEYECFNSCYSSIEILTLTSPLRPCWKCGSIDIETAEASEKFITRCRKCGKAGAAKRALFRSKFNWNSVAKAMRVKKENLKKRRLRSRAGEEQV